MIFLLFLCLGNFNVDIYIKYMLIMIGIVVLLFDIYIDYCKNMKNEKRDINNKK